MAGSTGSDDPHLQQRQLWDIEDVQDKLREWLAEAKFGQEKHGVKECIDEDLPKAVQPLLNAAGFQDKVLDCIRSDINEANVYTRSNPNVSNLAY
jgi:hypothetical protein